MPPHTNQSQLCKASAVGMGIAAGRQAGRSFRVKTGSSANVEEGGSSMVAPSNGNPAASSREPADGSGIIRIAALGDLHCTDGARGVFQPLFQRIAESADIMVLFG